MSLFIPDAQRVIAGGGINGDFHRITLSRCQLDPLETDQPLGGLLGTNRISTRWQRQVDLDHFRAGTLPGIGNPRAGAPGRTVCNRTKLRCINLETRVR